MTSHRSCNHPATSKARAACRAGRAQHVSTKTAANLGFVTPGDVTETPRHRARVQVTDDNYLDIARASAARHGIAWPSDEERAASLSKIWCTTCHLLHDLPSCASDVQSRRVPAPIAREVDPIAERKIASAREASLDLPTFTNARRLAADIPDGRYAVREQDEIKFYKIDKPSEGKWAGYVFLKIQASDAEFAIKSAARQMSVFAGILDAGVAESSRLYGVSLGACGVCGRTLTDAESIASGIGPVCARKQGW